MASYHLLIIFQDFFFQNFEFFLEPEPFKTATANSEKIFWNPENNVENLIEPILY